MHLYLIRHAQSYVNLPDWTKGNTDAALTDLGREQAETLARRFSQEVTSVDALYASDMMRAREESSSGRGSRSILAPAYALGRALASIAVRVAEETWERWLDERLYFLG